MMSIDGHVARRIRGKRLALGLSEGDTARALRIGVIHPINVLHDREAYRSERIGEQKRARVSSVGRDA